MKLALGTAQFGMPYGVANDTGQVSREEVAAIVRLAFAAGVDSIDTAMAYGDSEDRLGHAGVGDFKIVSKLPATPEGVHDVSHWVTSAVTASLRRLRVENLYGLLLHQPHQLLSGGGNALFRALERVKGSGLVRKIGISIYEPAELDELVSRFRFDIIQAPFNVLDRRLIDSGWLDRLAREGVEWHARSVFLQGLLAMDADRRPAKFSRWAPLLCAYDDWVARSGSSRLRACLRFVMAQPEISRVIVGVDSVRQMEELLDFAGGDIRSIPPDFESADPELLNPSRWAQH